MPFFLFWYLSFPVDLWNLEFPLGLLGFVNMFSNVVDDLKCGYVQTCVLVCMRARVRTFASAEARGYPQMSYFLSHDFFGDQVSFWAVAPQLQLGWLTIDLIDLLLTLEFRAGADVHSFLGMLWGGSVYLRSLWQALYWQSYIPTAQDFLFLSNYIEGTSDTDW